MKELIRPTKVLCKRTSITGDNYWWDDSVSPPVRHEVDNQDLTKNKWYDVVHNDNDVWTDENKTFTVLNNQDNPCLHYMYTDEQKKNFPDHCDLYGPRDYSKWFYTQEELAQIEAGTYKPSYKEYNDICVLPGRLHWVKLNSGTWVVAMCLCKHEVHGKHYWNLIGTDLTKTDFDLADIGEEVVSRKKAIDDKEIIESYENLTDAVFPLIDAINKNNPEGDYAPVEYHMQFVNRAVQNHMDKSFAQLGDFFGDKL